MVSARQMAVEALLRVSKDGAYSNLALDKRLEEYQKSAGKDESRAETERRKAETAFASTLFYGVLERRLTLDCCIEKYAAKGLKGMSPEVLQILRVAFYQLLFLPNIPESAVVNEAVKITRQMHRSSAAGFVNGVLRSFLRDDRALPHFENPLKELSILYSIPEWILLEWQKAYGSENAEQMASAFNRPSPLYIRANTLKCTPDELREALEKEKVSVSFDSDDPHCRAGKFKKALCFPGRLVPCAGQIFPALRPCPWGGTGRTYFGHLRRSGRENFYHRPADAGQRGGRCFRPVRKACRFNPVRGGEIGDFLCTLRRQGCFAVCTRFSFV